jgi:hypothetical protein
MKGTLEGGSWKGCENVRNKVLVVYSYEERGMEVTFKGGQDSYRVVEPIMMMIMLAFPGMSCSCCCCCSHRWGQTMSLNCGHHCLSLSDILHEYGESWWIDTDWEKPKNSEKNQPQCHFVHHISYMD